MAPDSLPHKRREGRTIFVEYIGGPEDSRVLSSSSPQASDAFLAHCVYAVTNRGTTGRQTVSLSEYGYREARRDAAPTEKLLQGHVYEVCERLDEPNELLIRMKYVGPVSDTVLQQTLRAAK